MTSIHQLIELAPYRSIVCLDGDLPEAPFFNTALPIIAADGAANQLVALGVTPSVIIGDLDAVDKSLLDNIPSIEIPDQDTNDYQKVLRYVEDNQLAPSIVCGINGGYLDHILNNVNLFIGTDSLLYAPPMVGFSLKKDRTQTMHLPLDTKLSLLGIPSASVSSNGLKWELDHYTLTFPGATSCFNRTMTEQIQVTVHEGQILLLIYL